MLKTFGSNPSFNTLRTVIRKRCVSEISTLFIYVLETKIMRIFVYTAISKKVVIVNNLAFYASMLKYLIIVHFYFLHFLHMIYLLLYLLAIYLCSLIYLCLLCVCVCVFRT